MSPEAWPGKGLWYDEHISEEKVMQSWSKVASALCPWWNVFAADLQGEPHSASWGRRSNATDWNTAAERIGNHVMRRRHRPRHHHHRPRHRHPRHPCLPHRTLWPRPSSDEDP